MLHNRNFFVKCTVEIEQSSKKKSINCLIVCQKGTELGVRWQCLNCSVYLPQDRFLWAVVEQKWVIATACGNLRVWPHLKPFLVCSHLTHCQAFLTGSPKLDLLFYLQSNERLCRFLITYMLCGIHWKTGFVWKKS